MPYPIPLPGILLISSFTALSAPQSSSLPISNHMGICVVNHPTVLVTSPRPSKISSSRPCPSNFTRSLSSPSIFLHASARPVSNISVICALVFARTSCKSSRVSSLLSHACTCFVVPTRPQREGVVLRAKSLAFWASSLQYSSSCFTRSVCAYAFITWVHLLQLSDFSPRSTGFPSCACHKPSRRLSSRIRQDTASI